MPQPQPGRGTGHATNYSFPPPLNSNCLHGILTAPGNIPKVTVPSPPEGTQGTRDTKQNMQTRRHMNHMCATFSGVSILTLKSCTCSTGGHWKGLSSCRLGCSFAATCPRGRFGCTLD
jgi:hypothetical protein